MPRMQRGSPGGAVAAYLFQEGAGTKLHDISGNGNHGTLTNMDPDTDWVDWDRGGYALDFDAVNDHVAVGKAVITDGPCSFAVWGRLGNNQWQTLVSICKNDGASTSQYKIALGADNTNHIQVAVQNNTTVASATSSGTFTPNAEHFIVGTVGLSGSTYTCKAYIDGEQDGSGSGSGSVLTPTETLLGITQRENGALITELDGQITCAVIFNRVLEAAEIASMYANPWRLVTPKLSVPMAAAAGPTLPALLEGGMLRGGMQHLSGGL